MQNPKPDPQRLPGMVGLTELASKDPASTRQFLERVFHWKFDTVQMPQGEYLTHRASVGSGVGIRATRVDETPASMNYVLVEDLAAAERKIRDSGGEIVLDKTEIPGMGSFFWFKAPGGPILACWQDSPSRRTQAQ
jgi:uncharacterized protein